MSEDFIAEIDEILSEELPDHPEEVTEYTASGRKQEMIDLLQYSADELGRSPSLRQFNELNLKTSGYVIENAFGTWNNAKREAGLEVYEIGEGKMATTPINKDYFKNIDSPEKAYWLGTLVASSGLSSYPNQRLKIDRILEKDHFVEEFSQAIESEYVISTIRVTEPDNNRRDRLQLCISNPTFIMHLISSGYTRPDEEEGDFPDLKSNLQAPFVRGYLESSGQFSNGWGIKFDNNTRAEALQNWFEDFGAKRPTLGESYGDPVTRVSNPFDIKAIYETCWPDGLSTEPSFTPYPKRILEYLQSEYPYPENVDYLSE